MHAEEAVAKLEADKKELSDKLGQISDSAKAKDKEIEALKSSKEDVVKENAKLKEKVKVIEDAANSTGGNDKQKDALIAVSCSFLRIFTQILDFQLASRTF